MREESGEVAVEDYGADGEGDGTAEDAGLADGALGGGCGGVSLCGKRGKGEKDVPTVSKS